MITNVTLTTKEKYLLEDQKSHEEQCILKYENYANLACDEQLKAVFRTNGKKEEEHLQTINQLLNGTVPAMGNSSSQQQSQPSHQSQLQQTAKQPQSQQSAVNQQSSDYSNVKTTDKDLCTDMLMTEKYVSGAYDSAIFEFKDAAVRDALNHIQKEEQKHGEAIFSYMQSKGMYTPK